MNIEQAALVLAKAAAIDNRSQSDAAILAWHEIIGDLDVRDALAAVTQHRIEHPDVYLQPGHVRRIAVRLRTERQEREFEDDRRRELAAYAENAGPLTDRTEDIQALVSRIRSVLPEGDVRALHPRREYWRREHQAYQRQANAEPNPRYRPRAADRAGEAS